MANVKGYTISTLISPPMVAPEDSHATSGTSVIATLECPKEDLGKLVKKLCGIVALPKEA